MAKERPTPEEQLLELIEDDSGANLLKRRRKKSFFFGAGGIKTFFISLKIRTLSKIAKLKTTARGPGLKTLNRIAAAFCVIIVIYSVSDFMFRGANIKRVYKKLQAVTYEELQEEPIVVPRSFLYYLEMVQRRNIFSPVALQGEKKPEIQAVDLAKLAVGLRVVGISWSKAPVAMIEDTTIKKTYFLKKGDTVNQFKIEDVLRDRVVLSYGGKTLELM
ncbi:MAG: hypothetical protein ABIH08_02715 [Candidatus Omnitrophota bacterium]